MTGARLLNDSTHAVLSSIDASDYLGLSVATPWTWRCRGKNPSLVAQSSVTSLTSTPILRTTWSESQLERRCADEKVGTWRKYHRPQRSLDEERSVPPHLEYRADRWSLSTPNK